ncbi:CCA tRNA nucleotidyltransferase [Zymomonas mobilis]|uniref:Polynucleotide adenylyltransferase region n=1 Tax=Zymomonas mobilis subsp. pomaceae (strain ATCC 29192 / DSM 22645 / JCM 10191 / CCUG 17912 / NBRC 13757 / NCIMB 11200 / NRRL B-4491 / Barker I) TaxID=579138 RepID=F8EU53_ZYMMT|nr:CCA tRNA nucleotidyltransferase [Zymomonas mobilis]AEI37133.1 Polynucleotide adenylyltransferase region [Zymomonas mobilis subsp. pomaceae ATCC 29192]MDX5948504.1 CCA tRNA nucleotidyltransferase [Zymomonas mobilis subsp. pomaceae]GEB89431.1 poly(A) polymerase [Zymomonas mobilis subsp. pomaceae]
MSIYLPDASWRHHNGLGHLIDVFGGDSMIRFVGGGVRDSLLKTAVSDIDCATRHHPEETVKLIKDAGFKAVPTGIQHGTVTAVLPSGPVEITSLRKDVSTDGRHATIAYSDSWQDDAMRRDFTINALYAEPNSSLIHDYFGGIADLEAGCVRFIGDPETRIAEDHLRILRYFRFQARFGRGIPDAASLAACIKRANDLMALSRERIASELIKILALPAPLAIITLMIQSGIFTPIIPEIRDNSLKQLKRLLEREKAYSVKGDPLLRLAALLPEDPELGRSIAQRLRFSKEQKKYLIALLTPTQDAPCALAWKIGKQAAIGHIVLFREEDALPSTMSLLQDWECPVFPLKGGDLIKKGLPAGPIVATTLQGIQQQWIEAGFPEAEWVHQKADQAIDQFLLAAK